MKQLNKWLSNEDAKSSLEHCQSTCIGTTAAGLMYDEEIASADGAAYTLFVTSDTTKEQIAEAKQIITSNHDVVSFHTIRVLQSWLDEVTHKPDTAPATGW